MMTIDTFEEVFIDQGLPYWRIYAGRSARGAKRAENDKIDNIEHSCELLMERLHQLGPGDYTVVCLSSPTTANNKGIQHPLKMGGDISGPNGAGGPGQYYGMSFQQVMEFAQMLNNQGTDNIGGAIEAAVEDVRKDVEIERLKAKVDELERGGARERIIEEGMKRLPHILDRVLGGRPQRQVAGVLGTAGIRETTDTPALEETGDAEEKHFSIDQAVNACLSIQQMLPDHDVNELLWKIEAYIKKDPEQAVNILGML